MYTACPKMKESTVSFGWLGFVKKKKKTETETELVANVRGCQPYRRKRKEKEREKEKKKKRKGREKEKKKRKYGLCCHRILLCVPFRLWIKVLALGPGVSSLIYTPHHLISSPAIVFSISRFPIKETVEIICVRGDTNQLSGENFRAIPSIK